MRIKSISFTNYRGINDCSLKLEDNLTVLLGVNGAGKSSTLKAVKIILSWIRARIISDKGTGLYLDELDIKNGHKTAYIEAVFDSNNEDNYKIGIPNKAKKGSKNKQTADLSDLRLYTDRVRNICLENECSSSSIPVFAFYGVRRAVIDIPLRASHKSFTQLDAYNECLTGAANFRSFFEWFRLEEDIENENSRRGNYDNSNSRTPLDSFRMALSTFMPEYSDMHIRRNPLRMLINKNTEQFNVAQLSDGEKIYLALVGDLCKRLTIANPTMENPLEGEGVVLIDELDLHLHPSWQQTICDRLTRTFPNIQFIISTHSPQVVNNINPQNIRILKDNNGGISFFEPSYSYGLPTGIIIKDIMGVEYDQPKEVVELESEIFRLLTNKNIQTAEKRYDELLSLVPELPSLVRMRKMIERLKGE